MTPSAVTVLGLLVATLRPATPCLAWVRFSGGPMLRRSIGGRGFLSPLAQQGRWRPMSTIAAAAPSSNGDGGRDSKDTPATPVRRRRTSSTAAEGTGTTVKKKAMTTKTTRTKARAATNKPAAASKAKPKAPPKPVFQPHPQWREQLDGIRRMREEGPEAPVDWAGCSELGLRNATSERHMRFQTLISSMMSSQTTDLVNEGAMRRLHEACGITIEGLEALGEEGIIAAIQPVSFYTAKAQNILKVCKILRERYDGDVPRTFEELLELPGIGPKMATLIMAYGWGEVVGICVDTHVHRISNRLGWADTWNHKNPKAQNPEKTRKLLESWMPREHWEEVNPLLVGLGQTVCRAISPKCHECSITHLCPSYISPEDCL